MKRFLLYLARWQLSTPILLLVLALLASFPPIFATIIANLIGGIIFYFVDQLIFKMEKEEKE
ncbi:hypothetical protein [Massilibacteroides sp.]|uniref:hypothetical protein n=1 Tax=Massilibacteroides sp. TaxID=2034766 RepID=UPI00262A3B0D|nr:hypothetical protein [Massilibacteroides sp.]MDD4516576.1 hypothetical protein [Massilibacteroides sp.]